MEHEIESLLRQLADLQSAETVLKVAVEQTQEYRNLTATQNAIAQVREALRASMEHPGKFECSAGTVSLVAARSVEYPVDAVRIFAPEVAALVIKTIPAREEVDRTALEKAVKAGMKAGTLAPDTLEKLESKAVVKELTPRFTIKLAEPEPVAQEATPF